MLAAAACSPGTLCLGNCSTQLGAPRCTSQLGNSPCTPGGCIGDCGVIGRIDSSCDPATAWLLPAPGSSATLTGSLPGSLSELVTIRDARGTPALDEASRWRDRLASNPGTAGATLDSAQKVVDLLGAALNGATTLLGAVGPARQGSLPGSGPPPISCEIEKSPGLLPLIDDFEDGDAQLLPNDGRNGSWSVGQDGSGMITTAIPPVPELGGADGSGRAMHLKGIRFAARGFGKLRVILMQQNLAPGHPCSTCETTSGECGQLYSTEILLSSSWSPVIIDWASLQAPTVIDTPFAPDQLMTLQFEMPAPDPFDLWIDDLSFTPSSAQ
jgi:hypothetical protein